MSIRNFGDRGPVAALEKTSQNINASTTTTINCNNGLLVNLAHGANITTLSLTNVPKVCNLRIIRTKDNSATERTLAWPASVSWVRNDGVSLTPPDLLQEANAIQVFDLFSIDGGVSFLGNLSGGSGGGNADLKYQSYIATAGQVTFTVIGGYSANNACVYVNGIKLTNTTDVDITNGTTFVLNTGAKAGDEVDFVGFGVFAVADTYTKAEIDNKTSAVLKTQSFTASAGQTVFTVSGGYTANVGIVFVNGAKFTNSVDVDISSGTTFTLTNACAAGDEVEFISFNTFAIANTYSKAQIDALTAMTWATEKFTATSGQTVFTVTGGYTPGLGLVYYNGVKLLNTTDVDISSGTTFTLTEGAVAGDEIEFVSLNAFRVANTYTRPEVDSLIDNLENSINSRFITATSNPNPAFPNRSYIINYGGNFTMPLSPTDGDWIEISDGIGFATHNLVLLRNGSTIMGLSEDFTLSDDLQFSLRFVALTNNWKLC